MDVVYFQGKWADLVNLINTKRIKKENILNINTFLYDGEIMAIMLYYEEVKK